MDFEETEGHEHSGLAGVCLLLCMETIAVGSKENWRRAKMLELGLPDFGPVQGNSFNAKERDAGIPRRTVGQECISIATGEIFGAWVGLRPAATTRWIRRRRSMCRVAWAATQAREERHHIYVS